MEEIVYVELLRLHEECFRATWKYRWHLGYIHVLAERAGYGVFIVYPDGDCLYELTLPSAAQEHADWLQSKIDECERVYAERVARLARMIR